MVAIAAIGLQALLYLLLAPALNGVIKSAKARLQNRRGPSVAQGYYDLVKWLRKSRVYATHSSWISRYAPMVSFAAILVAGMFVPTIVRAAPLGGAGDLIAVIYLFALARFVTALAALDSGSSFGGMAGSREMAIAALAEPVLFAAALVPILATGSTALPHIVAVTPGIASPSGMLAAAAFFIVVLAETGRVPVDNPDTHLELTMVHEGMILEATGPDLALYHWGAMTKQMILLSLLACIFVPWGLGAPNAGLGALIASLLVYTLKLVGFAVALAVVETGTAKLRIFRVPDLMGGALGLALLGLAAQAALHA